MNRRTKQTPRAHTYLLQVVLEVDEDGKYVAWCPSLQGCHTQGDTFEEAMEHIRDVIISCLAEIQEEKKTVDLRYPEVIGMKQIEVTL
jgi:predicted RNase H-like HicB family nuclease